MKKTIIQLVIVVVITTVFVLLMENSSSTQIQNIIFKFYLPGEFILVNMLGGFHGAPQWSLYLGIFFQNIIIWLFLRYGARLVSNVKNIKNT